MYGGTVTALNRPQTAVLPMPSRIAMCLLPVVAALIALTCVAVNVVVRAAVPLAVVVTAASRRSVVPTELHVPREIVTGIVAECVRWDSLRTTEPVPVVTAWIVAVPFAPLLPIDAFQELVSAAACADGAVAKAISPATTRARSGRRPRPKPRPKCGACTPATL